MQFLGVVADGRITSVVPGDEEAEQLLHRWPDMAVRIRERASIRLFGVDLSEGDAPAGVFDGSHVVTITSYAMEVMRELFSEDPARAGFVRHQRQLGREALNRDQISAARAALRLLVAEDFDDVPAARFHLQALRVGGSEHDARTAIAALLVLPLTRVSSVDARSHPDPGTARPIRLRNTHDLSVVLPAAMRIVVAEDDGDLAAGLAEFLQALGHEVAVASNAPRALSLVDTFGPNATLIDIGLPIFDGNFIASSVRSNVARPPRLIAMTGQRSAVDSSLFDDFVPKPLFPEDLLRALRFSPAGVSPADSSVEIAASPSNDDSEDTLT